MTTPNPAARVVPSIPLSNDEAAAFLTVCADYFERRPTDGEDAAHWSNVSNGRMCRKIAAMLSAAKPPASGVDAVAVKALEWAKKDLNSQFSVASWEALGFGGYYTVEERRTGVFDLWLPNGPEGTRHASPDEAMAAAQAIHEAGIRSALSPAATPVSEAGGEIDATQKLLDKALTVLGRCHTVLFNMAKENEGAIFNRWPIHHEPLRSDARNLLPLIDEVLGHD